MVKSRILLIEDERSIAENLIFTFENENFEIKWEALGEKAILQLKEFDFQFVILDINLPDLTGFEVCKKIRKFSNIPILFLTARKDEIDKVVGLEIGADDYMIKPFSLRELVARVKAILRRFENQKKLQRNNQEFPFRVDEKRQSVYYFDKPVSLTKYEYSILKSLLRHPGWIFSRDKLMDLTIGENIARLDRTIDSHIKSIRAKLNNINSSTEAIITHRGTGYSIKEHW